MMNELVDNDKRGYDEEFMHQIQNGMLHLTRRISMMFCRLIVAWYKWFLHMYVDCTYDN